jgi:hypothetical protein
MFCAGGWWASFNEDEGEEGKTRGEKEDSARLISDSFRSAIGCHRK